MGDVFAGSPPKICFEEENWYSSLAVETGFGSGWGPSGYIRHKSFPSFREWAVRHRQSQCPAWA
ncbi:MAG: hypothetical protein V8Q76_16640 [Bacteroides intestinalis]